MKSNKLIDAIGMIDDKYIEEAHSKLKKKFNFSFSWSLVGKLATAAVAILLAINIIPNVFHSYSKYDSANEAKEASSYNAGGSYYVTYDDAPAMAEQPYYASDEEYGYAEETVNEAERDDGSLRQNKKLILTASMNVETTELDEYLEKLLPAISKYGGYVQRSSTSNRGNNSRYYEATIRIPADRYSQFLEEIKTSGNATYYAEETKDITDTYTDIEARLTSLKAQEAKVLEFYDKAETIEDLMSVEERLSNIRYEIEYYEAQIKNYDLLVSYSTLNLSVSETKVYTPVSTSFFSRLARSFTNGFKNFISGIEDFIIDVTYNIWTIILFIALGYVAYRLYRWFKNRKK
ncbi:MAG: DUF4349 domain-containing protein [Erysipelotrichaceae bacterium]|nr:DUF4349 domain-containing protein [Erysipelotrichaceae bacterium]